MWQGDSPKLSDDFIWWNLGDDLRRLQKQLGSVWSLQRERLTLAERTHIEMLVPACICTGAQPFPDINGEGQGRLP